MTMIRTRVSFEADLCAQARASAKRRGISFAELCRQAVAEVVARLSPDQPWMSFPCVFEGSEGDRGSVASVVYDRDTPAATTSTYPTPRLSTHHHPSIRIL